MNASFRLARPFGIEIRVHLSFALALAWAYWQGSRGEGAADGLRATVIVASLFACVALHELGHSLMARRFGIEVRRITLYPVGGVAALSHMPERPAHELAIAMAGPLVNVVIAGALLLVRGGFPTLEEWTGPGWGLGFFTATLLVGNLALAVFNLLPVFPMDGGRLLRGLLALRLPYARATAVAAAVGRAGAIGLAALALHLRHPILFVVAFFVGSMAGRENAAVRLRERWRGVRAGDAARPVPARAVLSPRDPVARCAELQLAGLGPDFLVAAGGRLLGIVPEQQWMPALRRGERERPVADIMERRFVALRADVDLGDVLPRLGRLPQTFFPVLDAGGIRGIVTRRGIAGMPDSPPGPDGAPAGPARWRIVLG